MNFLVTNPANIRYLTGFTVEGWLVIDGDKKYLLTDSRYTEEAKKIPDVKLITNLKQFKTLEFEEDHLTVAQYKKIKAKLIPTHEKMEKMRAIKTPEEILKIKKSSKITRDAIASVKLAPGRTERDIAWEIETYFNKNGAESAFSPIVAFGTHASMPHYQPGHTKLKKNDPVLIDIGAKYQGYCADMTRVLFLGKPTPAYDVVARAQQKVFALLKAGVRNGAALDRAAKKVIKDAGFPPYQHGLGHGVGLDIHEAPRLSIKKDEILKPGMVFTVEPGTYVEGKYGIRIEDLVLLTKKGMEILT